MKTQRHVVQVKSGHRVEVVVPDFATGALVDVSVTLHEESGGPLDESILSFLDSLPQGPRAFPTWDQYEQHLKQQRDAWDQ